MQKGRMNSLRDYLRKKNYQILNTLKGGSPDKEGRRGEVGECKKGCDITRRGKKN